MNELLFLAFMVPGTFFLGLYDVLTKKLLSRGIPPTLILGSVYTLTGLFLLGVHLFLGFPHLQPGFWIALGGTIGLNLISQPLWFKAFRLEDASLISPLRMLTPPFVLLTGILFLHEIPSFGGILGVIVTMLGFWMLVHGEKNKHQTSFQEILTRKGVLLGIVGALLFAISFPLDKKAVITSSTFSFVALANLGMGLPYLCWNLIRHPQSFKIIKKEKKQLVPLFLVQTLGSIFCAQALHYTLAAYAAGGKRLWSVWTVLLSGSILKEKHIGRKLVATGIMLVGIVVSLMLQ